MPATSTTPISTGNGQIADAIVVEVYGLMATYHAETNNVQAGNRLIEIGDQLTRELVVDCNTLDELLDKWTAHQYRPTLKETPAAMVLADIYDFVAAARQMNITAYRGLNSARDQRTTMTAAEALEGAIEMLKHISLGNHYPAIEYRHRLQRYEAALDELRRQANIDARNRAAIQAMSAERRGA